MREKALLVTIDLDRRSKWLPKEQQAELLALATSAGAIVVDEILVKRKGPSAGCYIGKGKLDEISLMVDELGIGLVIFNNDLTGTQQKNIETIVGVKVVDRTQLILDIFARRAKSNEGKVQVELAQLLYLLPRLTGKGIVLSRLGGGIGTRGPGETKLEVDRRRIRDRIAKVKHELDKLTRQRVMRRKTRTRFSVSTVAIVGYTNAGKSTLLNSLTNTRVIVQDKLFSTLDPTIRKYTLPNNQKILLIDTVGFLRELPHHLIESFKATLEEVIDADILIHVIDASHPMALEQSDAVYGVLKELGAEGKPTVVALNKIDRIEDGLAVIKQLKGHFNDAVSLSALKRSGFENLVESLGNLLASLVTRIEVIIKPSGLKLLHLIYEHGRVLKREQRGEDLYIEAEVPTMLKTKILKQL